MKHYRWPTASSRKDFGNIPRLAQPVNCTSKISQALLIPGMCTGLIHVLVHRQYPALFTLSLMDMLYFPGHLKHPAPQQRLNNMNQLLQQNQQVLAYWGGVSVYPNYMFEPSWARGKVLAQTQQLVSTVSVQVALQRLAGGS